MNLKQAILDNKFLDTKECRVLQKALHNIAQNSEITGAYIDNRDFVTIQFNFCGWEDKTNEVVYISLARLHNINLLDGHKLFKRFL